MSLDKLLEQHNAGEPPDDRDIAELIDLAQAEIERLDELIDNLPAADLRVVIRVDNASQMLRLKDAAAMAQYVTEGIHERIETTI